MNTSEKAKVFMFVCIGLAALTIAAQQWVPEVTAQVGDNQIVSTHYLSNVGDELKFVGITASGDIWYFRGYMPPPPVDSSSFEGNLFTGGTVSSEDSALGGVKALFR